MSNGGKMRIGVEGARELEISVDDLDEAVKALEQGLTDGSMVWLTDSKGDRHGIVGGRLAFVEVEVSSDRPVSLGGLPLRFLAAAATLSQPALAETTAIFFWVPAPDARFLVGLERVLQAFFAHGARLADGASLFDMADRGAGCSDWEEDFRIAISTSGEFSPVGQSEHAVSFSSYSL